MERHADQDAALFAAAQAGDLAGTTAALAAGADVNAANTHQVTPLLEAVCQGHVELVQLLFDRGAETDDTRMREGSPLMLAAFLGHLEILRILLEAGADPVLALPAGGETALHMAAVAGRTETAQLLLDAGADPDRHAASGVVTDMLDGGVKLWAETPLHLAAAYGDEAMVRAMLAAGADRDARNAHDETPMEYAGRHRRPHGLRSLLKSSDRPRS